MKKLIMASCLLLGACATATYQTITDKMNLCGFGSAEFSSFNRCMKGSISYVEGDTSDYSVSRKQFLNGLDEIEVLIDSKQINEGQAYQIVEQFVNEKLIDERNQVRNAKLFAAGITVVGIAAIASKNGNNIGFNGGGGGHTKMILCLDGQQSPDCSCSRVNLRGCCSHHIGVAFDEQGEALCK